MEEKKQTEKKGMPEGKAKLMVKDGWGNLLSGYASRKANKAETRYIDNVYKLTDEELTSIWESDGFSRKVITCVAEDMVNKGFTIPGDSANIIINEMDKLNWTGVFFNAICKSRLFGGSAILMGIRDGRRLDKPVALNSIQGCDFLRVIPRTKIKIDDNPIDMDPTSKYYGQPMVFTVCDGISPKAYKVHRERLLLIPWIETSPIQDGHKTMEQRIWGESVMNYVSKQVGNLSLFHDALSNLVQEAVIGKYKLSNLANMLASGEESKLLNRLDIISEAKSVINGVVLDADNDEDYSRDSLSFAGMNGVADTMMVMLSGVSEIPVTRLFGRSPSGLDASGDSDLKIYYDMVSSYQKAMLTEPMKRLIFYIDKYKKVIEMESATSLAKTTRNGRNTGKPKRSRPLTESDVAIKWNVLYQMTEKEQAEAYKSNAETDKVYVELGILSKEEVRVNRFVGGYNQQISVEVADLPVEENGTEQSIEEPSEEKSEENEA